MSGEVTANLNTIPLTNLIVILAGVILIMIVGGVLIKIFNLNISKGSIKVADYENDLRSQATSYHLQETIDNIDFDTRNAIRRQTKVCNYKIAKIGTVSDMCQTARRSLYHSFKEPFYDYINANHFTQEFRPENIDSYKENLLENIREIYQELLFEYSMDDCDKNVMDIWEEVAPDFTQLVDDWLVMALKEVRKGCGRKINVYQLMLPEVEKSKHWKEILDNCVLKNEGYIKNINTILGNMKRG